MIYLEYCSYPCKNNIQSNLLLHQYSQSHRNYLNSASSMVKMKVSYAIVAVYLQELRFIEVKFSTISYSLCFVNAFSKLMHT